MTRHPGRPPAWYRSVDRADEGGTHATNRASAHRARTHGSHCAPVGRAVARPCITRQQLRQRSEPGCGADRRSSGRNTGPHGDGAARRVDRVGGRRRVAEVQPDRGARHIVRRPGLAGSGGSRRCAADQHVSRRERNGRGDRFSKRHGYHARRTCGHQDVAIGSHRHWLRRFDRSIPLSSLVTDRARHEHRRVALRVRRHGLLAPLARQ